MSPDPEKVLKRLGWRDRGSGTQLEVVFNSSEAALAVGGLIGEKIARLADRSAQQ